jgi:hypothetical protein
MRKFLSLLLAVMLCCAVFVSCGKAEQEPEVSVEPSVEVEASPSPTPEPRKEVGIPEELKFCDEPLYYGMTIEEIREIFGQEDETSERDFYQTGNLIGKHVYYKYNNAQCQGRQVQLQFRIFNYDGVVIPKSYGLDAVVIRWPDVLEEQASFANEEIKPIIENLYGEPDSVKDDGIIHLIWKAKEHDRIDILAKLADGPEITIETSRVRFWGSVGMREEAAAYKKSGKQGVTRDNFKRLKMGMISEQVDILLGPSTEQTAKYKIGVMSYATFVWESNNLWDSQIKVTFCDGKVDAVYSSGL